MQASLSLSPGHGNIRVASLGEGRNTHGFDLVCHFLRIKHLYAERFIITHNTRVFLNDRFNLLLPSGPLVTNAFPQVISFGTMVGRSVGYFPSGSDHHARAEQQPQGGLDTTG